MDRSSAGTALPQVRSTASLRFVLLVITACSSNQPQNAAPPLPHPEAHHGLPRPAAPAPTSQTITVTPQPLGLSSTARPALVVRRTNRAGLRLHRQGKFTEAEASFAQAVRDAPDYTTARFNWACSLAQLGRHSEAAAELVVVMHQNLPGFYERIDTDEDLASVRDSPLGVGLVEAREAVLRRYLEAFHRDVAVAVEREIVVRRSDEFSTPDTRIWFWPGVYQPGARRFVPMIRPVLSPVANGTYSSSEPRVQASVQLGRGTVFAMAGISHDGGIHCCKGWGPVTTIGLYRVGDGTTVLERRVTSSPSSDESLWGAVPDNEGGFFWNVTDTTVKVRAI